MENEAMARQSRTAASKPSAPDITWHGFHTLEERETRIREAAYYRYLEHGCCDGHDLEDWLAAEAAMEHGAPVPEAKEPPSIKAQLSSVHGAAEDDKLKRTVKRKPRKAIPAVESVEPPEAPLKE
jgi:hypothetical protein